VRALSGRIPRGLKDHRSAAGVAYVSYLRALCERWGPFDAVARPTLREAGLTELDLRRCHEQLQVLRAKPNRKRETRRLERDVRRLRVQLVVLERRLQELAQSRRSLAQALSERPS
jgi:hypothetical protein